MISRKDYCTRAPFAGSLQGRCISSTYSLIQLTLLLSHCGREVVRQLVPFYLPVGRLSNTLLDCASHALKSNQPTFDSPSFSHYLDATRPCNEKFDYREGYSATYDTRWQAA